MKKIKVLHLFFPGPMGGAEKVILNGLTELQLNNKIIDFELLVIKETRSLNQIQTFLTELEKCTFKYTTFECFSIFDIGLLLKLRNYIKIHNPHIIHAHGFKAVLYSWLVKFPHQKFVLTHHGTTAHTLKVTFYEMIEHLIMNISDGVIAVSKAMEKNLNFKLIKSTQIRLIENPLIHTPKTKSISAKSLLNLVAIGRLSPEKGLLSLIKAISNVRHLPIHLNIVGDGILKKDIEELIRSLNLDEKITLLGYRTDVESVLENNDALIMPSYREGLPMTLIEAACKGLPMIASEVGGIPSIVEHDKNGILFNPHNINEIEESIKSFVNNSKFFIFNAQSMSESFQKRFSISQWALNHIEFYQKL
jgi:glycosyltransferase involved in cell wall biosynthesis